MLICLLFVPSLNLTTFQECERVCGKSSLTIINSLIFKCMNFYAVYLDRFSINHLIWDKHQLNWRRAIKLLKCLRSKHDKKRPQEGGLDERTLIEDDTTASTRHTFLLLFRPQKAIVYVPRQKRLSFGLSPKRGSSNSDQMIKYSPPPPPFPSLTKTICAKRHQ